MKPSLRLRRWLSSWLVLAVLFMQFAGAAYACPAQSGNADAVMPCTTMMAEGIAGEIDPDLPGLCQQHCLADAQTLDHGPGAAVPGPAPHAVLSVDLVSAPDDPAPWASQRQRRERAVPPALSVLHCCYRI